MARPTTRPQPEPSGLRWNAWNLVLLVPLLMLVTPWFNSIEPRLFGMPFFYWYQFAWVPVGVACVAIVYARTAEGPSGDGDAPPEGRSGAVAPAAPPRDVDDLDEGAAR